MVAEPAAQKVMGEVLINGLGIFDSVSAKFDSVSAKSVKRYLCECMKRRDEYQKLSPLCLEIAKSEICRISWADDCFCKYVERMIKGADVTQLRRLYNGYCHSTKKTVFFLHFIEYEL